MAKRITKYTVFVSSPSDLKEERAALDEVIRELNLTYGAVNDCVIELLKWETHSAPGISKLQPQDLINKDIGDEYDIFLGLLWTRFGTPTSHAGSGTQEEFQRALARFIEEYNKPQILFYFNSSTPNSLNDIDPEQFLKVQNFKKLLLADNILFWEFDSVESLQNYTRMHIPRRIETLMKSVPQVRNSQTESEVAVAENDLGLFDYIDQYGRLMSDSTNSLERITEATEWIGTEITTKGEEITRIAKSPNSNQALLRVVLKRTAKLLRDYGLRVKTEIPIFHTSFEEAIKAGINLINLYDDFKNDNTILELKSAKEVVLKLQLSINNGLDGIISLRDSISNLPRIQKEINVAKQELVIHLSELVEKLENCLELSAEFANTISAKIDKFQIESLK